MPSSIGTGLLRLNTDGSLDGTFNSAMPGVAGKTIYIQNDGKIVVAGTQGPFDTSSEIYRMNADGSMDTTFGVNGMITLPIVVQAVTDAPQGGLLVAGAGGTQLAVTHLNSDGSVDTAYGTAGTATFDTNGHNVNGSGATLLMPTPDGKVVVVGQEDAVLPYPQETSGWLLARLNADGTVDSTFNGGQPVHYEPNSYVVPSDAKLLPDGSILIAGNDYNALTLARYNYDGTLDASFGTGGVVTDSTGNNFMTGPMKIQLRSTGEIFVEGFGTEFAYNGHFTPDGTLLQSETVASPVDTGLSQNVNYASAMDANGDVVAMGITSASGGGIQASINGFYYPLIGSRVLPDDYVWAGDPAFHWNPYPQPQSAPSTPAPTPTSSTSVPPTPTTAGTSTTDGVAALTSTTPMVAAENSMLLQLAEARKRLDTDSAELRSARRRKPRILVALRKHVAHDRSAIQTIRRHVSRLIAAEERAEKKADQ
jgi:uncharacterized delta-60 repeat protein